MFTEKYQITPRQKKDSSGKFLKIREKSIFFSLFQGGLPPDHPPPALLGVLSGFEHKKKNCGLPLLIGYGLPNHKSCFYCNV